MKNYTEELKVDTFEGIVQISINRPTALNAISSDVMNGLSQLFTDIKHNKSIRAILLTGEGKHFCAGADIKTLATLDAQMGLAFAKKGQEVFNALEQIGKPSVAAIHGVALGGGCELAMAATFRIAAENASFGQPEIKLGVIPGFGGTQRLSRLVGKGRALDLCLTGRTIKAAEALQMGLVNEVVGADDLLVRAKTFLQQLIQLPPFALSSIISVIDQGYDLSMADALELEAVNFGLCCATQDKKEGVSAFLEKRAAIFSGE